MKKFTIFIFLLVCAVDLSYAEDKSELDKLLQKQINSITTDDFELFIEKNSNNLKINLNESQFEQVVNQFAERFKSGYESEYLGELDQQGLKTHLWKINYSDQGDDNLIKLVLDGNEIAGFWIQ